MTGTFIKLAPPPHRCGPPKNSENNGPIHAGSLWQCDECKQVWVSSIDMGWDGTRGVCWKQEDAKDRKARLKEERRRARS